MHCRAPDRAFAIFLYMLGEVVGFDKGQYVRLEAFEVFVVEDFDCGVFDGSVHSLCLAVIRYEIRRRLCARLFPKGRRRYGEPIQDTGRREHEGAGRPPIDSGLRARARYMAAPCDFPGCAVSADQ